MYPHAPESEKVILASLIQNQNTDFIFQVTDKEMFCDPDNEMIYSACSAIKKMGLVIDVPVVLEFFRSNNQLDHIGGHSKITQLDQTVVFNIEHHCELIIDCKKNRNLYSHVFDINKKMQDADYEGARIQLSGVAREITAPVSKGHIVVDFNSQSNHLDFVWGNYIPTGSITMVSGNGGAGKTYFAMGLAISVATGTEFLGERVKNPGRVLYYSCEEDSDELRRRVRNICVRFNINKTDLQSNLCVIDATADSLLFAKIQNQTVTTTGYFSLQKQIDVFSPSLVIIDNSTFAFGGDENVKSEVIEFMNGLKSLIRGKSCGLLLISHLNRGGKTEQDNYSGSAGWNAAAKSRLSLVESQTKGQIILRHEKSNFSERHLDKTLVLVEGIPQLYLQNPVSESILKNRLQSEIVNFVRTFQPSASQTVFIREFQRWCQKSEDFNSHQILDMLARLINDGVLIIYSNGRSKVYRCSN